MPAHHEPGHRTPDADRGRIAHRPGETNATPTAPALLRRLQRTAGNRAVTQLITRPASVRREPHGYRPPTDSPYKLHLDPEIEAQIRAIQARS